jgi:hypothetical protein
MSGSQPPELATDVDCLTEFWCDMIGLLGEINDASEEMFITLFDLLKLIFGVFSG